MKTDFEINWLVAEKLGLEPNDSDGTSVVYCMFGDFGFDCCNAPSDWAQLMVDNEISLITVDCGWEAHWLNPGTGHDETDNTFSESPGRAVAECFLKMKGVDF